MAKKANVQMKHDQSHQSAGVWLWNVWVWLWNVCALHFWFSSQRGWEVGEAIWHFAFFSGCVFFNIQDIFFDKIIAIKHMYSTFLVLCELEILERWYGILIAFFSSCSFLNISSSTDICNWPYRSASNSGEPSKCFSGKAIWLGWWHRSQGEISLW